MDRVTFCTGEAEPCDKRKTPWECAAQNQVNTYTGTGSQTGANTGTHICSDAQTGAVTQRGAGIGLGVQVHKEVTHCTREAVPCDTRKTPWEVDLICNQVLQPKIFPTCHHHHYQKTGVEASRLPLGLFVCRYAQNAL